MAGSAINEKFNVDTGVQLAKMMQFVAVDENATKRNFTLWVQHRATGLWNAFQ